MYTLLIADDESLEREALSFFVNGSGLEIGRIIECSTGTDAVKKTLLEKPDIILLDINMPGLNGLEALERILVTQKNAKVIFSTAFDYFEYAVKALRLGAVDFLVKPVKKEILLGVLTKAIDQLDSEIEQENRDSHTNEILDLMASRVVCDLACRDVSDEIVYYLELAGIKSVYKGNCFYIRSGEVLSRKEQGQMLFFIKDIFSLIGVFTIAQWKDNALTLVAFSMDPDTEQNIVDCMQDVLVKAFSGDSRKVSIGIGSGFQDLEGICDCMCCASGKTHYTLDALSVKNSIAGPSDNSAIPAEISRACVFINSSYTKKIGLEDIAEAAGFSKYYLCHLFKMHMGITVVEYLIRKRLERARVLLQEETHSIKQISSMVGYSDPNYFTWTFKKAEGLSPLQYRYSKNNEKL